MQYLMHSGIQPAMSDAQGVLHWARRGETQLSSVAWGRPGACRRALPSPLRHGRRFRFPLNALPKNLHRTTEAWVEDSSQVSKHLCRTTPEVPAAQVRQAERVMSSGRCPESHRLRRSARRLLKVLPLAPTANPMNDHGFPTLHATSRHS